MANKFCMRSVGRNVNLNLTIPAEKLGSVLIAIGTALGGARVAPTQQKSTARSRRNQRRKSAQKDKLLVRTTEVVAVKAPAVITPQVALEKVAVAPTTTVVKQPRGPPRSPPMRPVAVTEKVTVNSPNRSVGASCAKSNIPIVEAQKSAVTSSVPANNLGVTMSRIKTTQDASQNAWVAREQKPVTTQISYVRADESGTFISVDPALFNLPDHLPGIPLNDVHTWIALKPQCYTGPPTVPSWMWSKCPEQADRMKQGITNRMEYTRLRKTCERAVQARKEFKSPK